MSVRFRNSFSQFLGESQVDRANTHRNTKTLSGLLMHVEYYVGQLLSMHLSNESLTVTWMRQVFSYLCFMSQDPKAREGKYFAQVRIPGKSDQEFASRAQTFNHQTVFTAISDIGTNTPETLYPVFSLVFKPLPTYGESYVSSHQQFTWKPQITHLIYYQRRQNKKTQAICSFVTQNLIKCNFFVLFVGFDTDVKLAMKTICKKQPQLFPIRRKWKRNGKGDGEMLPREGHSSWLPNQRFVHVVFRSGFYSWH